MTSDKRYIWQQSFWPNFKWNAGVVIKPLGDCRFLQGELLTRMRALGFEMQQQARAEILVQEALKTSEIEGELLDPRAVRSSVATRLGLPYAGLTVVSDQQADGVVDILLDATRHHERPLTAKQLNAWHAALFPTGYSGLHKIRVAAWRNDRDGPMRVVSGPIGREEVHYVAPPAKLLADEMALFFQWWAKSRKTMDGILRAGVAHLWFAAIHPFDDGNGRIARTLTEMALAQDESSENRYYSLSSQIMADRKSYYAILEHTTTGNKDITDWMQWFLEKMALALSHSRKLIGNILLKGLFWQKHARIALNDRQSKAVNRLLEAGPGGFEGGLTNRKYAGMTHVSRSTAQRELADLVQKGILRPLPAGGRSSSYNIDWNALKDDL